jgi:cyclopropane fatty-acyl-phospholipid synthase-like methyltransferase
VTGAEDVGLYLEGRISAEVAVARLLLAGASPDEIAETLASDDTPRVRELLHVVAIRREILRKSRAVFTEVVHEEPMGTSSATVERIGHMFDRAVAVSPEASVAAYSLGDPVILATATDEIVTWLGAARLIGPESDVLDVGCGIGRVAAALAGRVRSILGLDVSRAMIDEARRRCTAPNVTFGASVGTDLARVPSAAFDVVLAVDSFPYLMQAGPMLAERHVADAARILRADGALVILNFSYRGHPAADIADAVRWAAAYGFVGGVLGDVPFKLWDGRAFVLHRSRP